MTDHDDEQEPADDYLMARAAAGDAHAFGCLVRRHERRLLGFARRLLAAAEPDAAPDVVQETFLRLWRGRNRYQPQDRLAHLLLRIARRVCLDRARRGAPFAATIPLDENARANAEDEPQTRLLAQTLADAVGAALAELPEEQRAVFVLSHDQGLRYHEIADILGCPAGTVASRKHLAVAHLRRRLRPWIEEEETEP